MWVLAGLMGLAAVIYLGDWVVWKARGSRVRPVTVTRFVVAPLKGGKEEYYADGTDQVDCSVSLFGQGGDQPCWQLEKNRVVFER